MKLNGEFTIQKIVDFKYNILYFPAIIIILWEWQLR